MSLYGIKRRPYDGTKCHYDPSRAVYYHEDDAALAVWRDIASGGRKRSYHSCTRCQGYHLGKSVDLDIGECHEQAQA